MYGQSNMLIRSIEPFKVYAVGAATFKVADAPRQVDIVASVPAAALISAQIAVASGIVAV